MGKTRRRVRGAVARGAGRSLISTLGGAVAAGDDGSAAVPRFAKIDPTVFESSGQHAEFVPAALSTQLVTVVLELSGSPVAVQDADAQRHGHKLRDGDKQSVRPQLAAQQDQLHEQLAKANAQVVGQMQDAYNGIQVTVPESNIVDLSSLPGVIAIHSVQTFEPSNVNGVPFVGAPQAWQSFGLTCAGIKVGIIDTGIDYTHADFGGPGTVAAWKAAKATSTAPANPALFGR